MKYLLTLLLLIVPASLDAGCLFCQGGSRTVVREYNYGVAPTYTTYGYGVAVPSYRTYRVYRTVPTMVVAPQVGYAVPAPQAYVAPAQAPVASDPAPVQDAPVMQAYSDVVVDDADVVRVRHRERHKHGKHKVKHTEVSR
jgi:hypothetical protein